MTTKQYMETVQAKYPNTYIGFKAYCLGRFDNDAKKFGNLHLSPLDYMLTFIIDYVEYRGVNFIEALCNTQVENVSDNHQTIRLKTVTAILFRLEKFITPVEGQPF